MLATHVISELTDAEPVRINNVPRAASLLTLTANYKRVQDMHFSQIVARFLSHSNAEFLLEGSCEVIARAAKLFTSASPREVAALDNSPSAERFVEQLCNSFRSINNAPLGSKWSKGVGVGASVDVGGTMLVLNLECVDEGSLITRLLEASEHRPFTEFCF